LTMDEAIKRHIHSLIVKKYLKYCCVFLALDSSKISNTVQGTELSKWRTNL
jgi:hypothetical protein